MSMKGRMLAMLAMMGAVASAGNGMGHVRPGSGGSSRGERYDTKSVKDKVKRMALANGASEWTYDDGFECIARNRKNADRKHDNWLKSREG